MVFGLVECCLSFENVGYQKRDDLRLFHRLSPSQRRAGSGMDVYAGGDRLALGTLRIGIPLDLRPTFENSLVRTR